MVLGVKHKFLPFIWLKSSPKIEFLIWQNCFNPKNLEHPINYEEIPGIEEIFKNCLEFANCSAFLAITVKGAMPSMPMRE